MLEQLQAVGDTDDLVWCQQYIVALEAEVERLKGLLAVKAVHQVAEKIDQVERLLPESE